MEWMKPVNEMLKDEITKVNYTLIPPGCQGDYWTVRIVQESLGKLIDSLVEQSASARGLSKVSTTAEKLRNTPTYMLYLLKDGGANNGNGEIIGFLKVSYKHLYLFDERNQKREVEPLCVLDFFVSGARQRRGHGKRLFDYMLQDTGSRPQDLALEGPSSKMKSFLAKNYGVECLVRQINSYAVSPSFFLTLHDTNKSRNSRLGRNTPVIHTPVGRFAARQPPSTIAEIIHGGSSRVNVGTKNGTPEDTPAPPRQPVPNVPSEPAASSSVERPTTSPVASAVAAASSSVERPTTSPVAAASSSVERPTTSPVAAASSSVERPTTSPVAAASSSVERPTTSPVAAASSSVERPTTLPVASAVAAASSSVERPTTSPVAAASSSVERPTTSPVAAASSSVERPTTSPVAAASSSVERPTTSPVAAASSSVERPTTSPVAAASSSVERPTTLPVASAVAAASSSVERPTTSPAASAVAASPPPAGISTRRRHSQLTDRGYFDLKFYHNKLW